MKYKHLINLLKMYLMIFDGYAAMYCLEMWWRHKYQVVWLIVATLLIGYAIHFFRQLIKEHKDESQIKK